MKKQEKIHGDFGNGSVRRLILNQAIPLTLAQFVQLLYNIVDRIYIGHMPGADASIALTGIGLCFPIITLISAFVNGISTGGAPLCSMARGRGEQQKAKDILSTAFTLELIISVIIATLMYIVKTPLLNVLGASTQTIGYATDYLNIYLAGTIFFSIGTGMNTFINLQGYPTLGMTTTIIGAVINLILDPIFIFVFGMGVKGAATATIISQFCSALFVVTVLQRKTMELRLEWKNLGIRSYVVKDIITLGMPGFILNATNCAVQAVCNAELSIYGGDIYVGIMTIINSVREMISLPIHGITSGAQPVLSYNYGARSYDRVKKGIRFTACLGLLYTFIFWIITLLCPHLFLSIFTKEADVVTQGIKPLMIYFMGFIFMSLQFSGQSTFTALGHARHAIFFSIFRKIIIVVPLTILLPKLPFFGVLGVFAAEPISNLVGGCACFTCMYLTVYRKLNETRTSGKKQ